MTDIQFSKHTSNSTKPVLSSRLLKFRFWEILSQKFLYDIDALSKNPNVLISEIFERNDIIIPQQFTGLVDRLGKQIYEGDIFNCTCSPVCNKHKFIVDYRIDGFYVKTFGENSLENTVYQTLSDVAQYSILGNIYENLELL